MKRFILHIGLPKTGTSFIQASILPHLKSVEVVRAWHSIRKVLTSDFEKEIIFSDESLVGSVWNGRFSQEFEENMLRLAEVFENPKIIFGVRKPSNWVFSLYKQYLHEGGYKGLEHMFNLENTGSIRHEDLYFNQHIEFLKNTFDDVFVYSQESLLKRPQDFIDYLIPYLGLNESLNFADLKDVMFNVGVKTNLQVKVLKSLNVVNHGVKKIPFLPHLYSWPIKKIRLTPRQIAQDHLRRIKGKKFEMEPDLRAFIDEKYSADWEAAQAHVPY